MSIIERALDKLHGPHPRRAPLSPSRGEPASRAPQAPRHFHKTDVEQLRAGGVIPPDEYAAKLTDQFRRIKWPLLDAAARKSPGGSAANRIMVTSSVPGEGKTFTSLNLAFSIAREQDFSVLLVDSDVVKRSATHLFGLEARQGLMEVIADGSVDPEDAVVGTSIAGVSVLPAGHSSGAAPELFASSRMTEVVRALGSFDPRRIVLFDSSPLLATNESQVLARIVDQIVLVVRADSTKQPLVLEAIGLLDSGKQIRCILNRASETWLAADYYYYGYQANDRSQEAANASNP